MLRVLRRRPSGLVADAHHSLRGLTKIQSIQSCWPLAFSIAAGRDWRESRQSRSKPPLPSRKRANREILATWRAGVFCVPVFRLCEFLPRSRRNNNGQHYGRRCSSSDFRPVHVMPLWRSSSREARRLSSSDCCAAVKGSWSLSMLSQSCAINAIRSGGDNRTSSDCDNRLIVQK